MILKKRLYRRRLDGKSMFLFQKYLLRKHYAKTTIPNLTKTRQLRDQLLDHWVESGKIFTQFNGSPIHPSTITKWLNKFCKAKGLPHIYPHMLRHTSATMLLMQGLPLKAVSKRLGHAQASTTSDIYGHSLLSVDEIAAEALDNMLDPASKLKGTNDTN